MMHVKLPGIEILGQQGIHWRTFLRPYSTLSPGAKLRRHRSYGSLPYLKSGLDTMAETSLSGVIARKTLGTVIVWATVGLVCLQVLFYVSFGAAV